MSDWFSPSPGAVQGASNAAVNLIETVFGKLNEAEANTQYKSAYETLRKSTIDFNNSLATDPEHDKYLEKWSKAKDTIWKNSTRMVKNPDALRALGDTWQDMDIKQYENISGIQTKARINDTYNKAAQTSTNLIQDSTRSNEERKKELRSTWEPLVNAGIIDRQTAQGYYAEDDRSIDLNAAEATVRTIARSQGWESAISSMDNPEVTQFFPSLKPQDIDTLKSKMETQARWDNQQFKKQVHDKNSEIEDQFSHDLLNGKLTPDAIDKASLVNEPGGRSAGDIRKEWRATILSHPGRGVSDPGTQNKYLKWYYDPDVNHDADSVRQKLRELNADKSKLTEADYKGIGNDYLDLLKNPNKSDSTVSSELPEWKKLRTQMPDQQDAIDREENYFLKWRSMNRSASDKEVQEKSKLFQSHLKGTVLDQTLDELLTTPKPEGVSQEATRKALPATPQKPPKGFPNAQTETIAGKTAWRDRTSNTVIMTGDDGIQYKSVNGGAWTPL